MKINVPLDEETWIEVKKKFLLSYLRRVVLKSNLNATRSTSRKTKIVLKIPSSVHKQHTRPPFQKYRLQIISFGSWHVWRLS